MIDRGNEHQPYSSADRGAMEDVHSLRLLGHNAQEKLLILRHCATNRKRGGSLEEGVQHQ
jgi:hypothetical protein